MKTRNGFVSNSSSSSFIVSLLDLTNKDLLKLKNYSRDKGDKYRDYWDIQIDDDKNVVSGWSSIDNGDLEKYLGKN